MREVSVDAFLEYVRTSNVEAIETAVRQSAYDIDTQDDVSTTPYPTMHSTDTCCYPDMHLPPSLCSVSAVIRPSDIGMSEGLKIYTTLVIFKHTPNLLNHAAAAHRNNVYQKFGRRVIKARCSHSAFSPTPVSSPDFNRGS